jgi:hypothetical protein
LISNEAKQPLDQNFDRPEHHPTGATFHAGQRADEWDRE